MALLSVNMRTLAQNLLQDHETRMEAVADLRTKVRLELNNYRTAQRTLSAEQEKALDQHMEAMRREVAEASLATSKFLKEMDAHLQTISAEQRQQLGEHMLSLRGQVANASQASVDFLKEIDQDRQAMTGEQRRHLGQQMDDLHLQVNKLRKAAVTFLEDLDKSNQSMADDLSLKLTWQHSRLSSDTAAFINTIRSAHQEMASQQAQELSEQSAELQTNVRNLRDNAATFLKATDAAHRCMATAQKQSMVKGRSRLMTEVSATREKLHAEQSAVHADQVEAAKIWANISQLKQKKHMTLDDTPRVKKDPTAPTQAAESAWKMASPVEPSNPVDDFKVIRGIGPAMAQHLYSAGITTFKQLAASQPEQLYLILGKSGKLAKVETWITQAQDLT
jgi:predicted flap endonuclease-1-like 5' DNA nuclease